MTPESAQAALKLAQTEPLEPFTLREAIDELRRTREERDDLRAVLKSAVTDVNAYQAALTALVDAASNVQQRADVANLVAQDKALKAAQQVLNA